MSFIAVLLFDGVFLHRPEVRRLFDYTVFVDAGFEVTLARAMQRAGLLPGTAGELRNSYEQRYIPGQKLYVTECLPKEQADAVFDNTDTFNPSLSWRERSGCKF